MVRPTLHTSSKYQPLLRAVGIDAEAVFEHPDIKPWRTLADRENCLLDVTLPDGTRVRWHVKRYRAVAGETPADIEARGLRLLESRDIPTAPLVAYGNLPDRRSFLILDDLAGYTPGDKLIGPDFNFDRVLEPVADLAARLHNANLHHRDLYLCHFLIRPDPLDVRLIDAARVKELPRWPLRTRWIVKDLAQLWYSTVAQGISDAQRKRLLERYVERTQFPRCTAIRLERSIISKAARIAKHDKKIRLREPGRNISISR